MKEQLVTQLKTQIVDLERFINYLQGEVGPDTKDCTCACPVHAKGCASEKSRAKQAKTFDDSRAETLSTIGKIVALLHIFITSHVGCAVPRSSGSRKSTYSWGHMRTRLDLAVETILDLLKEAKSGESIFS